jgi:two-component system, response regulator, stage 0 sporulation protein A
MQSEKLRIMVVDDSKDFTDILCDYLSGFEGFEIAETASDGLTALKVIQAQEPDVVIMDIVMPNLDGLGVLENLKKIHMEKKPQFIMLSAIGQDKTIQIALSLGADFFIVKPFDMNDLVSRIRQLQLRHPNDIKANYAYDITTFDDMNQAKDIDLRVTAILNDIGVPSHLKGYKYLKYAITMVIKDLTAINSVTKLIYTSIADEYKTTPTRVERAIRNAIELTWCKGNIEYIDSIFTDQGGSPRPTNSEFIIMIASQYKRKLEETYKH